MPPQTDLTSHDPLTILARTDPFSDLSPNLLKLLAANLETTDLVRGEYLFQEGEYGDAMYIVISGRLRAGVGREKGEPVEVGLIGPGEPVGEMQTLTGGIRTADIRAEEDCRLLMLPNSVFERLAEQHPGLVRELAELVRRRFKRNLLATVLPRLLGPLEEASLRDIESEMEWVALRGGDTLFEEGQEDDSFYVLLAGRLKAVVGLGSGRVRPVGELGVGELVGEMAVISGQPRSATVCAVRDCRLAKFHRESLHRFLGRHPGLAPQTLRIMSDRLRRSQTPDRKPDEHTLTVAVIHHGPDAPVADFCHWLVKILNRHCPTLHLSAARLDAALGVPASKTTQDGPYCDRLTAWLDEQESRHRVVIYQADDRVNSWSRRCLRQADRVLVLAPAGSDPRLGELEAELDRRAGGPVSVSRDLVLIHPDGDSQPQNTARWLTEGRFSDHHHLRWDRDDDLERLARVLTGRAVGLVLGGGGARGFAHIGVILALRQAGVPIDYLGGTSMGAVVASLAAQDWEAERIADRLDQVFNRDKLLAALTSTGRTANFERLARQSLGESDIADLWRNYFCIAADLSAAEMTVLRRGPLWRALRASAAIPGVLSPLTTDSAWLVDGGVLNNLPGDVMAQICPGSIIAVDVAQGENRRFSGPMEGGNWWDLVSRKGREGNGPSTLEILIRAATLGSVSRLGSILDRVDLYLAPPLQSFGFLDFKALADLIEAGRSYALPLIRAWASEKEFGPADSPAA